MPFTVDDLGYSFSFVTIDGNPHKTKRNEPLDISSEDSSSEDDEQPRTKRRIRPPEGLFDTSPSESEGDWVPRQIGDVKTFEQVRQEYNQKFKKKLNARMDPGNIEAVLLDMHEDVHDESGFFEIAIKRMLSYWQVFRTRLGKKHKKWLAGTFRNDVERIHISENEVRGVENLNNLAVAENIKCCYVSVHSKNGAHAIVLLKEDSTWHLFDPNGSASKYVTLAQQKLGENGIATEVIQIDQNSHEEILNCRLMDKGMTTSRYRGWCSLWALCIIYLKTWKKCSVDEIKKFANNQLFDSPEDWSFVLVALRNGTVKLFRLLCDKLDKFESQFKENPVEFKMWETIFDKEPQERKDFSVGKVEDLTYFSVSPSKEMENVKVKVGSQRFNQSHVLTGKAMYIKCRASFSMIDFHIGMHIKLRRIKNRNLDLLLKDVLQQRISQDTVFGSFEIEEIVLYKSTKYREKDQNSLLWAEENSKSFSDSFETTGNLFHPVKSDHDRGGQKPFVRMIKIENPEYYSEQKLSKFWHWDDNIYIGKFYSEDGNFITNYPIQKNNCLFTSIQVQFTIKYFNKKSEVTREVNFTVCRDHYSDGGRVVKKDELKKAFDHSPRIEHIAEEAWSTRAIRKQNKRMEINGLLSPTREKQMFLDASSFTNKQKLKDALLNLSINHVKIASI